MVDTTDYRLRDDVNRDEIAYELPDLPTDDTEPNELGMEPKPCVRCQREPQIATPVMTTNRAIDEVNGRVYLDPVCEAHDNMDPDFTTFRLLAYADVGFLADAVSMGVISKEEVLECINDTDRERDYFFLPDDYTPSDELEDEFTEAYNERTE